MEISRIRNFSIIAHIDHGKTTLSDRLLDACNAISKREQVEQYLDGMDLERERGITIKAHSVSLTYKADDGNEYLFNLIDTPGHVDFSYEVSRSLAACEGALLVVDASQGVEAQTLANAYLATENNLEIIPVINKIDLPSAHAEEVLKEIEEVVGLSTEGAILASAKEGKGIHEIMEAIVSKLPPPKGKIESPLKAIVFDSWYDDYRGVIILIRVVDGRIENNRKIAMMSTGKNFNVEELGKFIPRAVKVNSLGAGEVGYLIANIKEVRDCRIGDTITDFIKPTEKAFPGFKEVKPMVFAGLYPVEASEYENLKVALDKLRLNDSSFVYEPETSEALGFGFRCGFLGFLHMEIVQERLEREFNLELVTTAHNVRYEVLKEDGELIEVENPSKMPLPHEISEIREPVADVTIITKGDFVGPVLNLLEGRRGLQKGFTYSSSNMVVLNYEMPLSEIMTDFYDKLKSVSKGYASLDYTILGFKTANLVKLDIMINGQIVDALSSIAFRDQAQSKGRFVAQKLRKVIPRQLFEVVIQAAIGAKIIARETISPMRKNVLAKCYGGDITRKRKLLEKQREGKKRMKQIGSVSLPQEAFLTVLQMDKD